ncbi:hypothetical protein [Chryseobacterium jejuense]|uniref:hypothetical protein n=1 Tax=Chryseobacterium jejuense TaxID=445960 RepID=UPI001AE760C9|nr:hypothetical protein [Chryseobacterium jejuense]MBP2618950.1 AraC-like DNA-binding protein [Chryseobacterium jejuense]
MNRNYQLTYEFKKLADQHLTDWKTVADYSSFLGISTKYLAEVIRVETGNMTLQIIHKYILSLICYILTGTFACHYCLVTRR